MTGFRNAMMGAAGAAGAGGYSVDNSAVFNDDDSQYLIRENASNSTTGGADARKKFTISLWWKHGNIPSGGQNLFIQRNSSSNYIKCAIAGSGGNEGALQFFGATLGAFNTGDTSAILRDFHAWYHILFYYDSTDGTAGDRARIYLNGTRLTDFQTSATNPSSGAITQFGSNNAIVIGQNQGASGYSDGYMAEMVVIDGQALTPDNFTETDSNGVLRPLNISAQNFTFGDQGFYLPFTNSAGLGQDYSGSTAETKVQENTYNAGSEVNNGDMSGSAAGIAYTAIATAKLATVKINSSSRGFTNVTVQVQTDNGSNAPDGTTLTNGEVTGITGSGSGLKTVDFPNGGPELTAGTKYWIVIPSTDLGSGFEWGIQHDVSGSGGALGIIDATGYQAGRGFGHEAYQVGNHFKAVNSPTQTTDTPTNNHCVWSEVFPKRSGNWTLSEGNRKASYSSATDCGCPGSIGVSGAGTWYFEITASSSYTLAGIVSSAAVSSGDLASSTPGNGFSDLGGVAYGYYANNGYKLGGPSNVHASYGATFANTDVIGVAFDAANGTLTFYKNGSTQGQAFTSIDTSETWFPFVHTWTNEPGVLLNNGQTAFAYTPPTGYVGINTTNLLEASAPAIEDGSAHFQATLYTGNGGSLSVTQDGTAGGNVAKNSTFKPDLLWTKKRSGSGGHALFDIIRTNSSGQFLRADNTDIEKDEPGFASFDTKGFSWDGAGTEIDVNASSGTFVGWQWLADNTTGSSNTDGSITSTVSVNQTAGFSILTYTGTGSAATVGHGLNAVPEWILTKKRAGGTVFWAVYHAANTSAPETEYLKLNTTDATADDAGYWNDTAPTSSVFSINNESAVNTSGHNYVAYCWCGKSGFSKFGSYEGNGNADGVFIELGFKPALFIAKNIDTTGAWLMFDSAREPFNLMDLPLEADDSKAEAASGGRELDFLSNGVKLRGNSSYLNSSHTFIYMAFAEHPFAGTTPATAR